MSECLHRTRDLGLIDYLGRCELCRLRDRLHSTEEDLLRIGEDAAPLPADADERERELAERREGVGHDYVDAWRKGGSGWADTLEAELSTLIVQQHRLAKKRRHPANIARAVAERTGMPLDQAREELRKTLLSEWRLLRSTIADLGEGGEE